MKLTVLVPSEAYRSYAGARIRYSRIAPELRSHGIDLELADIGQFDPASADCDAMVVSKCHDGRSLIAAAVLANRGKLVGVDLFDDYFSQSSDSRLMRYRNWLAQLVGVCDFALCSTEPMTDVVRRFRSSLATHVMNDPAPDDDFGSAPAIAQRKVMRARDNREIRLCWFGVGDNPYFQVGLPDLAAFGNSLAGLSRTGCDVRLTVVTNERALSADGLAMIGGLPIRTEIREWSEAAEQEALQESLVAFLPVSAQRFSIAKSLNRAVTALSAGCQALSAGFPLYEALEPLIYRDPEALLEDLESGTMRLGTASEEQYRRVMESSASAGNEASALAAFLHGLTAEPRVDPRPLCLIHGHSTRQEGHHFIRQVNGLSVASPYCSAALDFDVVFRGGRSGLKMLVAKSVASRLRADVRATAAPAFRLNGNRYLQVFGSAESAGETAQWLQWEQSPVPFQLATYRESMRLIGQGLTDAFGPCRTFISEPRPLPFPLVEQDA
jgi:hypothetical protein